MKTEVLIYNNEKKEIDIVPKEKEDKILTDLITSIKDKLITFSESSDSDYSIFFLNQYQELLKQKSSKSYSSKENEAKEIDILYINVLKDLRTEKSKNTLEFIEEDSIFINYTCVKALCELIIEIIKQIINNKDFSNILNKILIQNKLNEISDKKIWDNSIIYYIKKLQSTKNIIFSISSNKDDKHLKLPYFFLLYHFFQFFFRNVHSFKIDLNVQTINETYHKDPSPYKITECTINQLGEKYENVFLANYIFCQLIYDVCELETIQLILDESYIKEIDYIFKNFYKNYSSIYESSILFKKISLVNKIKDLRCEFNCLDPFLFKSFNEIFFSHRNIDFIDLNLFPVRNFIYYRKILFNTQVFLKSKNMKFHHNILDLFLDYQNYSKSYKPILLEEKIPKYLYKEFVENLFNLKIGLNLYILSLKSLKLDISPYFIISKYDEYVIEIILFIYNIIQASQYSEVLKNLTIRAHNIVIPINLISKLNNMFKKEIDFSNSLINTFKFSINNLFHFIPLKNFPYKNIENLSLENLKISEFKELTDYLKLNREKYTQLQNLEISLDYSIDDIPKNIYINFFKSSIPSSLIKFKLTLSNDIQFIDLASMIKEFNQDKINDNSKINFIINCDIIDFFIFNKDIKKISDFIKLGLNNKKIKYKLLEINSSLIKLEILRYKLNENKTQNENEKEKLQEIFNSMDETNYLIEIKLDN